MSPGPAGDDIGSVGKPKGAVFFWIEFLKSGLLLDHAEDKVKSSSHWKAALVPGLRIDHIFTSSSIKKASVQVDSNGDKDGNAASDHHPVRLRVPQFLETEK